MMAPPQTSNTKNWRSEHDGVYHVIAGRLFDSHLRKVHLNQVVTVDKRSGIITRVESREGFKSQTNGTVIDLQHLTVLPGFVDTHVHMFLHSYKETSWNDQLTKESLAERSLRAGANALKTLQAGFTTVRDLGTEGAEDADIALRKCLAVLPGNEEPIIPGPRYYCANRAIVSTGSYGPKSSLFPSQNIIEGITGAEAADGVEGCVRAVRRQIGAGADWIKIYADYRVRSRLTDVSVETAGISFSLFKREELAAMIDIAHDLGAKVAAHANTASAIRLLLDLGIDSIEHGANLFNSADGDTSLIRKWAESGGKTVWVPTLSVFHELIGLNMRESWETAKESFLKVLEVGEAIQAKPGGRGIRISCGGDTGAFPHGLNGSEMVLMRKLGAEWAAVLSWATLGGWQCIRGMEWEGRDGEEKIRLAEENSEKIKHRSTLERGVPFGAIQRGWAGDLVGVDGVLDGDADAFEKSIMDGVVFVMKGGVVVRSNGL